MIKLEDVFGVSGKNVKSHIERKQVDAKFIDALRTDKQLIVYGASKQGKTALVRKYVKYEDNIVISLSPRSTLKDIYQSVLRKSDVILKTSYTEGTGVENKVKGRASIQGAIALIAKAKTDVSSERKRSSSISDNYEEIEFNLELPDDVSDLIHRVGNKKIIILENFHYLPEEIQRQFAFDLRTFQDLKVRFVILGVWKEANRLNQFNGELQDRIVEIPVEPWTPDDFRNIAAKGAKELNVDFATVVLDECVNNSFDSVGVFQELLKVVCRESGINAKGEMKFIDDIKIVASAINEKANDYSGRHLRNLEAIAAGNNTQIQKDKPLPFFMHYYIVKHIIDLGFEGINGGINKTSMMHAIKQSHHRSEDVKGPHLTSALRNIAELQVNKGISPPVLAYDSNSKQLKIVDSTFYFFLKNADLSDIDDEIINPLDGLQC